MKSTHAIFTFVAIASAAFSLAAAEQTIGIPGVGIVVKSGATAPQPTEDCVAYPERCKDAKAGSMVNGGAASAAYAVTKSVDINTASEQTLAAIPSIGPQTARAIVAQRGKGLFKNSKDFAARLCTQHSIDFGFDVTVKIHNEMHAPRGDNPKAPGWKCAAGQKTFETSGVKFGWDIRTTETR